MCSKVQSGGQLFRGQHHPNADTDKDPHSPQNSFWHSYIGWIHNKKLGRINLRVVRDLRHDKFHLWLNRNYTYIVWATFIILSLINFEFMLWFWAIFLDDIHIARGNCK